ncbi:MAG: FkbM family methyltransferase [Acidimicrobiales bacterium]
MREEVRDRELSSPLRLWADVGGRVAFRGQQKIGAWLAGRMLEPDAVYATRHDVKLRIDASDYFQRVMALCLYERPLVGVIRHYAAPSSIVLDVGSHIGYFALLAGRAVGPGGSVHAFECDPRVASRLRQHVELNAMPWVEVNEVAVLDRSGDTQLDVSPQWGWSSARPYWDAATAGVERTTVSGVSLDDYVGARDIDASAISLMKIDVEGAEMDALAGAAHLLDGTSAAVVVEYVPDRMRMVGQDPAEMFRLMRVHSYAPWAARPSLRPSSPPRLVEFDPTKRGDVVFLKG